MKKSLVFLSALLLALPALAQLNGDGYYRVKNKVTGRYIRIVDDHIPDVDVASTSIDMSSLESLKPFDKVISDPASVIYIQFAKEPKAGQKQYILRSQGADTYKLTGYYLYILESYFDPEAYWAFGMEKGITKYLNDERGSSDEGMLGTNDATTRDWYVIPITNADDQCFGLKPDFTADGARYLSFYASFPIRLADDMSAYVVRQYKRTGAGDAAELVPLATKDIPSATPVIIKCLTNNPYNNKVTILSNEPAAITGTNLLKGQYFSPGITNHTGQRLYDPTTMRVLGRMEDGKLGLVKADESYLVKGAVKDNNYYLPSNRAYVEVPSTSGDEAPLLIGSDYTEYVSYLNERTGVGSPQAQSAAPVVYTLQGVRVSADAPLAPGVYIVNGKKKVVR